MSSNVRSSYHVVLYGAEGQRIKSKATLMRDNQFFIVKEGIDMSESDFVFFAHHSGAVKVVLHNPGSENVEMTLDVSEDGNEKLVKLPQPQVTAGPVKDRQVTYRATTGTSSLAQYAVVTSYRINYGNLGESISIETPEDERNVYQYTASQCPGERDTLFQDTRGNDVFVKSITAYASPTVGRPTEGKDPIEILTKINWEYAADVVYYYASGKKGKIKVLIDTLDMQSPQEGRKRATAILTRLDEHDHGRRDGSDPFDDYRTMDRRQLTMNDFTLNIT